MFRFDIQTKSQTRLSSVQNRTPNQPEPMPEQASPQSTPQPPIHTTSTLKALLLTTTQTLSTLPTPSHLAPTLPHHTSLKHHILTLLNLIHTSLTKHKSSLTHSLTLSQTRLKNFSGTLSTLSTELSQQTQLRAKRFETSIHRLQLITTHPLPGRTNTSGFGASLSLLPFVRPAGEAVRSEQKLRDRAAFSECVHALRECDESVRRLQRTREVVVHGMRDVRKGMTWRLAEVKEVIRATGQWGVLQVAIVTLDDGFEEFGNVQSSVVWDVICARWLRVVEAVRKIEEGGVEVEVERGEDVVKLIMTVLRELCLVTRLS